MAVGPALHRAFAIWFRDLTRWNPGSFRQSVWHWPIECIKPLSTALVPKHRVADKGHSDFSKLPMLTLGFDGEISLRGGKKIIVIKGNLFIANAGDVVFSKIDVRNGAIGIVPESMPSVAVTSEFPVYGVRKNIALPSYIRLLFRTEFFRKTINSMISGASGRKRVQPSQLMSVEVPLPPLPVQQTIVDRWEQAQKEIAAAKQAIERQENEPRNVVSNELGIATRSTIKPRSFAVCWNKINRWGFDMCWNATYKLPAPKFSTARIKEICHMGSGGTPLRKINAYYDDGDIPWVKTTEVRNEVIMNTEEKITRLGLGNSAAKLYPPGSLLVAMYGQGATRGRTAKLGIEAATNQACCVLYKIDPRVDIDYLWFFLISEYDELRKLASGNNQPNLNSEMIANYEIPLPPLEKQRQIVEQVNALRLATTNCRKAIETFTKTANAEIEDMIMGTKRSHREQEI